MSRSYLLWLLVAFASCGELAPYWEGSNLITIRLDGVYISSPVAAYVLWWTPSFEVAAVTRLEAEDPKFRRDYRLYHPPPQQALHDFPRLGVRGRAAWGTAIIVAGSVNAVPLVGEAGQGIGARLEAYAPQSLFYFEDPTALPGGADYYHLPLNPDWAPTEPADHHQFVQCPVDVSRLKNPERTFLFLSLPPRQGASVVSSFSPSCRPTP